LGISHDLGSDAQSTSATSSQLKRERSMPANLAEQLRVMTTSQIDSSYLVRAGISEFESYHPSHAVGLCRWEGRPLWRALRFTIGRAFTPTLQCYLGTVPCILDGFRLFIVQSTSAERSERARSSPPPAPMGLRGAWVVAARCCAGIVERSFGMSKGKRARSAKTRSTSKVRAKASLSEDESQSFIPSKSDSRGRLKCRLSPPPPWCSPATVWRLRNGNWLIPFRTKPIGDICVGVGLS